MKATSRLLASREQREKRRKVSSLITTTIKTTKADSITNSINAVEDQSLLMVSKAVTHQRVLLRLNTESLVVNTTRET